jgi:ABC-type polysaccharide/polyol phosphate transport system ATPase subunit
MVAIRFENVTKSFAHHAARMLLRERLMLLIRRSRTRFTALSDVSFEIEAGESLAVIGPNGAGKSTLLNLATGLAQPDSGRIQVRGRVAPILELGSGFHPDLTGEENLRINSALLGLKRAEAAARRNTIVEFSGIGDFMREPLRTWSAGMQVRLAFSIAVHADADILIVDEVLGVGDQAFYAQCLERIKSFRKEGKTLLMASHSLELLRMLADRALWLEHGRVVAEGPTADVVEEYRSSVVSAASS